MTLTEMSRGYQDSAEVLGRRLQELRAARRRCRTRRERQVLDRRVADLVPLLRQCRELAELTGNYYERSYCRNEKYRV